MPPSQDRAGYAAPVPKNPTDGSGNFGSAHPAGFHMAFGDGRVQKISYDIAPNVHMQLGHRADGQPTDASWAEGRNPILP
jgi:hypothetical protein